MKHIQKGRKFHRPRDQRRALFKIMASDLIIKEKIKTTEAKAKSLRPKVEKLITKAKDAVSDSNRKLAVIRILSLSLCTEARKKIVEELALRYKERHGGYVRITKLSPRKGDAAKMAVIELIK